jgi:site-specific recombinase XerD
MTANRKTVAKAPLVTISTLLQDWSISLRAAGRAELTLVSYVAVGKSLDGFLQERGMPREVANIRREHVEAWLAAMTDKAPATRAKCFRSAQQLFRWLLDEGEIERSPMERMRPPTVPRVLVPVLSEDQIKALLKVCDGPTFENRRDTALIRTLLDTGCRASEVMGLRVEDVDLVMGTVRVTGKGSHERIAGIGPKACEAIRRYLRARTRAGHPSGGWLWLGRKGRLTDSGLRQVLERRGMDAEIDGLHPHVFRHTLAHRWLAAGGQETDLMSLAGWRSRQMVQRYGESAQSARALGAHKRLNLNGDL